MILTIIAVLLFLLLLTSAVGRALVGVLLRTAGLLLLLAAALAVFLWSKGWFGA